MRRLLLAALALCLAACEAPQRPLPPSTRPIVAAPAPAPSQALAPDGSRALGQLGLAVRGTPGGLLVVALDLDGPAARAGARGGDFLIAVNGQPIASAGEAERLLRRAGSDAVQLGLLREGRPQLIAVAAQADGDWNPLGLQVRELPRETLKALELSYGLMVSKVRSPADRTRILPGDVIVGVDQVQIRSLADFNRLVARHGAGAVGLLVRRADSDLYIAIDAAGEEGGASAGSGALRLPQGVLRTGLPRGRPLRT
ncbi:MAG: PDZ domain-containing protein [Clostridia bacterium]